MTDKLRQAAKAVVDRWDSLLWGGSAANLKHTGEYIAALRAALEQPAECPICGMPDGQHKLQCPTQPQQRWRRPG